MTAATISGSDSTCARAAARSAPNCGVRVFTGAPSRPFPAAQLEDLLMADSPLQEEARRLSLSAVRGPARLAPADR